MTCKITDMTVFLIKAQYVSSFETKCSDVTKTVSMTNL